MAKLREAKFREMGGYVYGGRWLSLERWVAMFMEVGGEVYRDGWRSL